jgi:hypothetical protein
MLRRLGLVRNDVSEEPSASIIRVTRRDEVGTLAVTKNRRKLRKKNVSGVMHLISLLQWDEALHFNFGDRTGQNATGTEIRDSRA